MRQPFPYKMRQKFIAKYVRFFITEPDSFVTKCDSYFKLRRLLQIRQYRLQMSCPYQLSSSIFLKDLKDSVVCSILF